MRNSTGNILRAAVAIAFISIIASAHPVFGQTTAYNALFNPTTSRQLYVSTYGNDANPGTSATYPFRTIQKAANVATAGTTVQVAPGVYRERVTISKSGTASAHIVFKSTNKWKASVQGSAGGAMFTIMNANYVDIIGFDMTGNLSTSYGSRGVAIYGSYNRIVGNHIHGFVTTATSTSSSAVGGVTVFWNGQTAPKRIYNQVRNNVIHDIYSTTRTAKLGACIYIADAYGFIANNLVYTCGSYGIEVNHMTTHETIINNTVANIKNGAAIMMSVGGDSTYNIVSDYNVVENNVVVDSIVGISGWEGGPSSHFGTHNVWKNNLTYGNATNVSHGNISSFTSKVVVTGDTHVSPLFVSKVYSSANTGNFRVQSSSPAINTGATAADPTIDLDGGARPMSGAFDRGAYEYGCKPVVY